MPRFVSIVLLLVLPFLAGTHAAEATSTSALPAFCTLAPTANIWHGTAADDWEANANWSTGTSPHTKGGNRNVCIPAGNELRVQGGQEAHLRTVDIRGTLTVDQGGKLFLFGDRTRDQDSVVRGTGLLDVTAGTLGGIAKLHVLGTVTLTSNATFASTLLVRECTYFPGATNPYPGEEDCTPPATPVAGPKGLIEVAKSGVLDVVGGGINLGDQFQVRVRGLLAVHPGAYIAADHGTRLELAGGTLRFEGDGGYLEGKIKADTGISEMSTLVNHGLIEKTGGGGRTLISATYSQSSPGKVSVDTGELLLPDGPATPASVAGGVTYGTGKCADPNSPTCMPTTTRRFKQSAQFRVPAGDTDRANVVVRKLLEKSSTADLGRPFVVHATQLSATAVDPAVITMRFDATVLNGKTSATVRIFHKSGTAPYLRVKDCAADNSPPPGEVACVDRGASHDEAGDAVMAIRTVETSRWVGR